MACHLRTSLYQKSNLYMWQAISTLPSEKEKSSYKIHSDFWKAEFLFAVGSQGCNIVCTIEFCNVARLQNFLFHTILQC